MSQTARDKKRHGSLKKTDLDAVRETENEDGNKSKKKGLDKSKSNNQLTTGRSKNGGLMKANGSTNSINSDLIAPKAHRCHGQSNDTRGSVFKLRHKGAGGLGSRSSSIADFNSPSRNNLHKVNS